MNTWTRFPTDEMSLRGLIEACTCNEETGRSHLHDYLDMTARVASVTNEATGEVFPDRDSALEAVDEDDGIPIFFVEHEPGSEPHTEHTVIISLAEEIMRLRLVLTEIASRAERHDPVEWTAVQEVVGEIARAASSAETETP